MRARYQRLKANPAAFKIRVEQSRERTRKWRSEHREQYNAQARGYYKRAFQNDRERLRQNARRYYARKRMDPVRYAHFLAVCREWAKKHPEKKKLINKKWKRTHPLQAAERLRHDNKRRRARRMAARGSHTQSQWMDRVHFYGWRCVYCGKKLHHSTLTKDHRRESRLRRVRSCGAQ